jgi:hypothetical protein
VCLISVELARGLPVVLVLPATFILEISDARLHTIFSGHEAMKIIVSTTFG